MRLSNRRCRFSCSLKKTQSSVVDARKKYRAVPHSMLKFCATAERLPPKQTISMMTSEKTCAQHNRNMFNCCFSSRCFLERLLQRPPPGAMPHTRNAHGHLSPAHTTPSRLVTPQKIHALGLRPRQAATTLHTANSNSCPLGDAGCAKPTPGSVGRGQEPLL